MGLSKEFRVNKQYPVELQKQAVYRVLSGELRKSEALKEYGIGGAPTLDRWLEKYGHGILTEHKELLSQMGRRKANANTAVKGEMPELEQLRHDLAAMKKKLEAAELRAEAYSMMIDIAERELKVAIRKKSVTK
ncbi:MAG: hypothetical protein M9900_08090 [Flavobacteriales bacterium]|jgi:transposase-like protein|nr:hypothetical protein [Flavobacteriales bacterium]MCO5274790.1 hypothetical protein [Flavobacteriales bacterium]MCO5274863.1 hypothetical protein [Flavobacteriales bacterium]